MDLHSESWLKIFFVFVKGSEIAELPSLDTFNQFNEFVSKMTCAELYNFFLSLIAQRARANNKSSEFDNCLDEALERISKNSDAKMYFLRDDHFAQLVHAGNSMLSQMLYDSVVWRTSPLVTLFVEPLAKENVSQNGSRFPAEQKLIQFCYKLALGAAAGKCFTEPPDAN